MAAGIRRPHGSRRDWRRKHVEARYGPPGAVGGGPRLAALQQAARQAVDIAATGDWLVLNAEARLGLARALAAAGGARLARNQSARAALEMHRAKGYALGVAEAEAFLRSIVAASA